jgi:hypothetical protein
VLCGSLHLANLTGSLHHGSRRISRRRHANRSGHDDADDERCFQHLAEDYNCNGKHETSAYDKVAASLRIEVVEEFVRAGPERADIDRDLLTGRDDLFASQLSTFEF